MEAGAQVGDRELQFAAEDPCRLELVLCHIADDQQFAELTASLRDWLVEEVVRARQHLDEAAERRVGAVGHADRLKALTASLEAVSTLR